MRLLVDQDGVISSWGGGWDAALEEYGDEAANIPRHSQQTSFDLNAGRTLRERQIIREVMEKPGFYEALEPIEGARTALRAMLKAGHDVRIVTSPWVSNPTCASAKYNWVKHFYGSRWAGRVIQTTDKTLIRGDYLIDDKPEVTGADAPTWEHVIFEQPYNLHVTGKRRITRWEEWEEVLGL